MSSSSLWHYTLVSLLAPLSGVSLRMLSGESGLVRSVELRTDCMCSRKISWNATLLVGGIFGLAAGAAPNFPALCVLIAFVGFGVGGNLPVDGTLFIEFVPGAYQYLLTLLSVWWAIGQVVSSLIAVSDSHGAILDSD